MEQQKPTQIKALIGLGNPGRKFEKNRHNIGFRILDELADTYAGSWNSKHNYDEAIISIQGQKLVLIKPQTYMNNSGEVLSHLSKQGIKGDNIIVIHDELELPYTKVQLRHGGSSRGHNGLKSIMEFIGKDFWRLRIGIGRPEEKAMVPDYVLSNFTPDEESKINEVITNATTILEETII